MNHEDYAVQLFGKGYVCSQAVFASFAKDFDFSEEDALKIGACFGSGMRRGEVCGACTGALMALGLKYGESKEKSNAACKRFLDEFESENGSIICNELLGCDITTESGVKYAKDNGLFTDFCPKMVESAAVICKKIILE